MARIVVGRSASSLPVAPTQGLADTPINYDACWWDHTQHSMGNWKICYTTEPSAGLGSPYYASTCYWVSGAPEAVSSVLRVQYAGWTTDSFMQKNASGAYTAQEISFFGTDCTNVAASGLGASGSWFSTQNGHSIQLASASGITDCTATTNQSCSTYGTVDLPNPFLGSPSIEQEPTMVYSVIDAAHAGVLASCPSWQPNLKSW